MHHHRLGAAGSLGLRTCARQADGAAARADVTAEAVHTAAQACYVASAACAPAEEAAGALVSAVGAVGAVGAPTARDLAYLASTFSPTERECRSGKSDREADSPLMGDVTPHLVTAREG